MRVRPSRWKSSSVLGWLLLGLALHCLSPCSMRAHLELQEPAAIAREKMTEPRKVAIRLVRKTDGQPISGAIVVVCSYHYDIPGRWRMEPLEHDEWTERLTDGQGRCLIEGPSDITGLTILSGKAGLAPSG